MKIVLVGNYANDEQQSMQRFTASLERGLKEAGHEVRILRPRSVVGQLSPSWRGIGKWLGYIDKFGIFPRDLKASLKWADVVHICDQASSIYTKDILSFPHIVTCHDLLAVRSAIGEIPEIRTRWSGKLLQRAILNGVNRAQHIVCVSEATRRDLIRIAKISDENISVVYNSLNHPYSRMKESESASRLDQFHIDSDEAFLLHVGGNQWYKNRLGVLRIFGHLRKLAPHCQLKLVMVGKPWAEEMRGYVRENGLSDAIVELHNVENEDLRALYSKATLMLFPSLQEGFGWPIIEAQACGCPVVTSNRAPMTEIGGSGAIYINPDDERLAAFTLKSVLPSISAMRAASVQNAARFNESAMIHGYVSAYTKVQKRSFASQRRLVATLN
jgi:glycosyltransferase involved in cell wall biosynthesis